MDEMSQMMAEAAAELKPPKIDNEGLESVSVLVRKQLKLENRMLQQNIAALREMDLSVPELEAALKLRKEELAKVRELELPSAIEQFGISEVKLTDGSVVSIKEEVYAGITEENKEAAFNWFVKTGNDGLIKNEVKVPFGKGQDSEAKLLLDLLSEKGYSFTNSKSVHPQTLKSFIKHRLEDGEPTPLDIFSIHIKKVANIKVAR